MKNKLAISIILIIWYFLLKYHTPYWYYIIYPINLVVTFLHEFWHALWALLTWWSVNAIQINTDWSWFATTSWWVRSIVLMWGYIWSAILWNILLYIWLKKDKYSEKAIYVLAWLMIFTWIFWFNSIISSLILFFIAWIFILLAKKSDFDSFVLQFLWVVSLLYIMEDFNWWPSSDLSKFSDIFIFIPQTVWMYIWLIVVFVITVLNLKNIFKK